MSDNSRQPVDLHLDILGSSSEEKEESSKIHLGNATDFKLDSFGVSRQNIHHDIGG